MSGVEMFLRVFHKQQLGLVVLFLFGHTWQCFCITLSSVLRNRSCYIQGPYGMPEIEFESTVCKAIDLPD